MPIPLVGAWRWLARQWPEPHAAPVPQSGWKIRPLAAMLLGAAENPQNPQNPQNRH